MFGFGVSELSILVAIVCILFSGRVVSLFRGLGSGLYSLRKEVSRSFTDEEI